MISPETLAYLNHTDNPHLAKYRAKYKKHPIKAPLVDLVEHLKVNFIGMLAGGNITLSYKRRSKMDKIWLIYLLQDYRFHVLLSEGAGRKVPFWDGSRFNSIDRGIAPFVFALNKKEIRTGNSCEGRINNIKGHSCVPYITTRGDVLPKEILNMLD